MLMRIEHRWKDAEIGDNRRVLRHKSNIWNMTRHRAHEFVDFYLTSSTEQHTSWGANSSLYVQEISEIYGTRRSITATSPCSELEESIPHRSILLLVLSSLRFPHQNFVRTFSFPHMRHMLHTSLSPWFEMKLLIIQFSPLSSYFLTIRPIRFASTQFPNVFSLCCSINTKNIAPNDM